MKIKVGAALADDKRRCAIARDTVGDDIDVAVDANQVWDVPTAIAWINELAPFRPAWVEEPTAPEDVLGTAAIRGACDRPGWPPASTSPTRSCSSSYCRPKPSTSCRSTPAAWQGVNENIANLLLASKFGVPVCPHAGGVGLCEIVQHLSMFDYVALSGTTQGRQLEWIDHLHEHFAAPATIGHGQYRAPETPGASTEILPKSLAEFSYPSGPAWRGGGRLDRGPGTSYLAPSFLAGRPSAALRACQRRGGGVLAAPRAFDTALHYGVGVSERRIGEFLAGRPRNEFTVCTKVGRRLMPATGDVQGEEGFYDIPSLPAPPSGLLARAGLLRDACASYGIPLPAAALQFTLRHPAVTAAVVGAAPQKRPRLTSHTWRCTYQPRRELSLTLHASAEAPFTPNRPPRPRLLTNSPS